MELLLKMTGTPPVGRRPFGPVRPPRYRHDRHPVIHLERLRGGRENQTLKAANVTVSCCVCEKPACHSQCRRAHVVILVLERRRGRTRRHDEHRAWQRLAVGVQEAARDGRAAQGQAYPARTGRHRVLILVFQFDCDGHRRLAGIQRLRTADDGQRRADRQARQRRTRPRAGAVAARLQRAAGLCRIERQIGELACPRTAAIDTGPPSALLLWASAMATSPVNP